MHRLHWIYSHISWTFLLCSIVGMWWWLSLQRNTQRLPVAGDTTCDQDSVRRIRTARILIAGSQVCLGASVLFAVLHFAL